MTMFASHVARLVHERFEALPGRSKPCVRGDGTREWVPMVGVVVVRGESANEEIACVAVTSGAKCLPASQVSKCKGLVLHDWHAEVLALRAFNYWLLCQCRYAAEEPGAYVRRRTSPDADGPPFELNPDVRVYMYCTCAPCGDASMELCMAAQEDATPWDLIPSSSVSTGAGAEDGAEELLDGRGYFSRLGIVRRKPARADAEATRSKSCSDKLALRQVSSLLSYETSLLVAVTENAYLEGIVLPETEITAVGYARCFGEEGRMAALKGREWSGYRFRAFTVLSVPREEVDVLWAFGKEESTASLSLRSDKSSAGKSKPAVVSAVWVAAPERDVSDGVKALPKLCGVKTGLYETIINGVKQGNRASEPMARGASALSRARLWGLAREIVCGEKQGEGSVLRGIVEARSYREFKKEATVLTGSLEQRKNAVRDAKAVLKGWTPNIRDEEWGLEVLVDPKKRKRGL
ncbi:putative tRNA-specific adenosine deaminase [Aspergillus avenaceus]|uniref:Putative tRNA-specific adenosine deaminase n=1 Tax=Aspergillus avenaceus TaxID=36643 RepID=A0A5N6TTN5_ASPAV|nr:putative tRNA-specific adenosine deaminase [Aspergillus avenaceus]